MSDTHTSRSVWWMHKDVDRLLGRAAHSSGGPASDGELRYLRVFAQVLMAGPLPLADGDRVRVERLYGDLLSALAERADERIEGEGDSGGGA